MPLKVPFDLIGPAEDAAEVVDIGITQRIQLLDGVSAAAAGAAVDQPGCTQNCMGRRKNMRNCKLCLKGGAVQR